MKIKIPNLKKILKPTWAHNPGEYVNSSGWHKQKILEQGTIPKDKKILEKLGIKKRDKILAIAGFYASWASALKRAGAKVDYSDISKSMVKWTKRNVKTKFGKYIISNYELIPKIPKQYDWTFTYEACGGSQGLPIAYLRSLLNNKGGILIYFINKDKPETIGGKAKSYPRIVNLLSKIYNTKCEAKTKIILARRKDNNFKENLPYFVGRILTNDSARKRAEEDLTTLKIGKGSKESIKRLNKLSKVIDDKFNKEIEIK